MSSVKVLFFGRLADLVAESEISVAVNGQISAEDLYIRMADKNASLPSRDSDPSIKVAINQTLSDWKSVISEGDEVAFLPPVTGG